MSRGQGGVWKWVTRLIAAVIWGACAFGFAAQVGLDVNVSLSVGWWAFAGYFMGSVHDDRRR